MREGKAGKAGRNEHEDADLIQHPVKLTVRSDFKAVRQSRSGVQGDHRAHIDRTAPQTSRVVAVPHHGQHDHPRRQAENQSQGVRPLVGSFRLPGARQGECVGSKQANHKMGAFQSQF